MNKKKGFTLAELLIVVAIIAVLVGVAIPVFTTQLEKSKEAVDLTNLRSAYAECTTSILTGVAAGTGLTLENDNSKCSKSVDLTQGDVKSWTGDNANAKIGNAPVTSITKSPVIVEVDAAGNVTLK